MTALSRPARIIQAWGDLSDPRAAGQHHHRQSHEHAAAVLGVRADGRFTVRRRGAHTRRPIARQHHSARLLDFPHVSTGMRAQGPRCGAEPSRAVLTSRVGRGARHGGSTASPSITGSPATTPSLRPRGDAPTTSSTGCRRPCALLGSCVWGGIGERAARLAPSAAIAATGLLELAGLRRVRSRRPLPTPPPTESSRR